LGLLLVLLLLTTATAILAATESLRAVQARGAEPAAARLLAGMTDEQSGLLAYVDSARPDSLVLYRLGQQEAETSLGELRDGTAGTPEAGPEAELQSAARDWEEWAEGMRKRVAGASAPVIDPTAI